MTDLKDEAERRRAQLRAKADTQLEQFRLSLLAEKASTTPKPLSRVELARQVIQDISFSILFKGFAFNCSIVV